MKKSSDVRPGSKADIRRVTTMSAYPSTADVVWTSLGVC
jgi:hypothetical protein